MLSALQELPVLMIWALQVPHPLTKAGKGHMSEPLGKVMEGLVLLQIHNPANQLFP